MAIVTELAVLLNGERDNEWVVEVWGKNGTLCVAIPREMQDEYSTTTLGFAGDSLKQLLALARKESVQERT